MTKTVFEIEADYDQVVHVQCNPRGATQTVVYVARERLEPGSYKCKLAQREGLALREREIPC